MFNLLAKFPFKNNFNTDSQTAAQKTLFEKIESGEYSFQANHCLCGNRDKANDIVVSNIDSIGVAVNNILCKKCSLIRLENVLNDDSLVDFYQKYYTELYIGTKYISDESFSQQFSVDSRSHRLFDLIKELGIINDINNVFEAGCGAGWNLWPYHKDDKTVSGCDYGIEFLNYGISKGLDLHEGSIEEAMLSENSQDLIILSHVLEHIADPISFLQKVISFVKCGGYIQIEVPGVLNKKKSVLVTTFQLPHIFSYNKLFLTNLFNALGLEILYIDDEVTCVLKKPKNWKACNISEIQSKTLENEYHNIAKELKKQYSRKMLVYCAARILKTLKIKDLIKKLIGRS